MDSDKTTAPLTACVTQRDKEATRTGPPKWRSSRFILAYMLMWANAVIFLQRVSFSMVIVCMVNHTALDLLDEGSSPHTLTTLGTPNYTTTSLSAAGNLSIEHVSVTSSYWTSPLSVTVSPKATDGPEYSVARDDPSVHNGSVVVVTEGDRDDMGEGGGGACDSSRGGADHVEEKEDGPFVWDKQTQGFLLGAVYWGYMTTQVLAGHLFYVFGARRVCVVNILAMSLLSMLCHPAAYWSPWAVFALRVAVGVCTSFAIPSMFAMWGKWAPTAERATLVSLSFSGQNVANSISFPVSALLCKYGFAGGWPSVFYVCGILGVIWCVAWMLVVADSPETLKWIHPDEKEYIMANRSQVSTKGEKVTVPWRNILTATCFWAIVGAQVTFTWGLFLLMSNLPLYMYEVMKFDLKSNGLYSMLPYIALGCVQMICGLVCDTIVKRKILTLFWARRLVCVVSNLIPAVCLFIMSYLDCTHVAAVMTLLILSVGLSGFAFAGFLVNPFDIAPRYAISIASVSNSIACIPGILTPYVVAMLTPDKTREQWQIVFFITGAVYVCGTIIFCIFAKTSVQSWAVAAPEVLQVQQPEEEVELKGQQDDCEGQPPEDLNGQTTALCDDSGTTDQENGRTVL